MTRSPTLSLNYEVKLNLILTLDKSVLAWPSPAPTRTVKVRNKNTIETLAMKIFERFQ